tara:strand:- start:3256 stop:3435 length:180 start_codon:yes stop_codon:yes gene_type:complete
MVKAVAIVGYIVINGRFVVDGVLKVLKIPMSVMIGEKDILKDKTINFISCMIFMLYGQI